MANTKDVSLQLGVTLLQIMPTTVSKLPHFHREEWRLQPHGESPSSFHGNVLTSDLAVLLTVPLRYVGASIAVDIVS